MELEIGFYIVSPHPGPLLKEGEELKLRFLFSMLIRTSGENFDHQPLPSPKDREGLKVRYYFLIFRGPLDRILITNPSLLLQEKGRG